MSNLLDAADLDFCGTSRSVTTPHGTAAAPSDLVAEHAGTLLELLQNHPPRGRGGGGDW